MKKFSIILSLLLFSLPAFADLELCFKSYPKNPDDVFMLSVSAINQNRYDIVEMQSKSGYILFRAHAKDYLLTVSSKYGGSNVKVVPTNSNFSNGVAVQGSIFSFLDANINDVFKKVL